MEITEICKLIKPNSEDLIYNGRIDFTNPLAPIFIFPASSVSMCFTGVSLKLLVENNHSYYDNYIGYIIDGEEKKILLSNDSCMQEITLAIDLEKDKSHEVIVFKRQDGCHEFTFYGFNVSKESKILIASKIPRKCIEFYGDSAVAGELIDDVDYLAKQNPKHNGQYSNAWHSYAMVTARNLKAQVSIIAQEGISLLDGKGYFQKPECIGMESIYDKLHFNPDFGDITSWNFRRYTPQVVVIDIGQNDSVPLDYMKEDENGEKAKKWKKHYREFVLNIRRCYPSAFIVLTTTIKNHHPSWDRAIGQICLNINDVKIHHFLYICNGRGTSLCIRAPEAEQMAFELSIFLKGFGNEIW
ncbi:electron transporter RnfD [Clostridium lacusfryxellense]|uniref:electron transporter RnfD n=1 Tax=Clostridium lacusfryxellense TaxID=205328 RepID=UPI001C0E650C|nr:electron transporter RnfD [Clostridium lacusfryxellense]MBU3112926.1 electron transporter RnfD [Clostridium lacusfryxellense]